MATHAENRMHLAKAYEHLSQVTLNSLSPTFLEDLSECMDILKDTVRDIDRQMALSEQEADGAKPPPA